MLKSALLTIILLQFCPNEAKSKHFWAKTWNRALPKPLKSDEFHEIIANFNSEFDLLHEQLNGINSKIHKNHHEEIGKSN